VIKRIFDIIFSFIGIIICSPFFILIPIIIVFTSGLPVFYKQARVGRNGIEFSLFKFRTMVRDASKSGLLTIGERDSRITTIGVFLRKYKLDELPQLFNILTGDMSIVGPRPETPNHVACYDEQQKKVLTVRPGLTDYASIEYIDESRLLAEYPNPEEAYIKQIMPAKLEMNLRYIGEESLLTDMKIIFITIKAIFRRKS
jgi:lipopolysaccharide/colanic/teichoic acid biosynthesis glycosyltransferase